MTIEMVQVKQRIGVFGGSFDPPHVGHVQVAQAAIQQLRLDLFLVVPTGVSWHKQHDVSLAEHRLSMVKLAFSGLPKALVDDREIKRDAASYTIDTIIELRQAYPSAELFLIVGQDQAERFLTWKNPIELLKYVQLCVALRPDSEACLGVNNPLLDGIDFITIEMPKAPISSTQLRSMAKSGQSLKPWVDDLVIQYIEHHNLYSFKQTSS